MPRTIDIGNTFKVYGSYNLNQRMMVVCYGISNHLCFGDLKFHNTQGALLICYVFMQVLFVHIVVWTLFMFFLGLCYCCLQGRRYFGLEMRHHFKPIYIIWFMCVCVCVWTTIIFIGIKMVAHDKGYIMMAQISTHFL